MINQTPFMELLNERLRQEERILKLRHAELLGDTLRLEFLMSHTDYDNHLTDKFKKKINTLVAEILPPSVEARTYYVKTATESKQILRVFMDFLYANAPLVYPQISTDAVDIGIRGGEIEITLRLEKYLAEYMESVALPNTIAEHLEKNFMESCTVTVIALPNDEESESAPVYMMHNNPIRTIAVQDVTRIIGTITQNPRYIVDIKDTESDALTICGTVSNLKSRHINTIGKTLFTFLINDTTGRLPVKIFVKSTKNGQDAVTVFTDGKNFVLQGKLKHDSYENRLVFTAKSIAECVIPFDSIRIKSNFLNESECYRLIHPAPYADVEQQDFFTTFFVSEALKNREYVVFDVETTGLNSAEDLIIEIAAVKVVDGKITESFSTLVNPERVLPAKITEVTGITDDMLAFAPTFSMVVGDFYKFTRNCTLVAHNAPFDMGFLQRQGLDCLYDFNNDFMDTLALARQKLKLKKYKLAAVAAHMEVKLEGAHRALNDAVATAKIFIRLMNLT